MELLNLNELATLYTIATTGDYVWTRSQNLGIFHNNQLQFVISALVFALDI